MDQTPAHIRTKIAELFAAAKTPEDILLAIAQALSDLSCDCQEIPKNLVTAHNQKNWSDYSQAIQCYLEIAWQMKDHEKSSTQAQVLAQQGLEIRSMMSDLILTMLSEFESDLVHEFKTLTTTWQRCSSDNEVEQVCDHLKSFSSQVIQHVRKDKERKTILKELMEIFLSHINDFIDEPSWLQGQVQSIRKLISGPMDLRSIVKARNTLSNALHKQGMLKKEITGSRKIIRQLRDTFIDRLNGIANSSDAYHIRFSGYSRALEGANSIPELNQLLQEVAQDTSEVQIQALATRNDLLAAQQQVEEADARVAALEQQLRNIVEQINEDQLTGALNRRGLEETFLRESSRTQRGGSPLCLALLDLDNFRHINESFGHAGGDAALCHFVSIAQESLRITDTIARHGGEEFIIIMPDTSVREANAAIQRFQQALRQKKLTYADNQLVITFSAGIAVRHANEQQDALIHRADLAMYEAKSDGKDRIVIVDK